MPGIVDYHHDHYAHDVMAELHHQQQNDSALCDIVLHVRDEKIHAHACVLVACSEYFRTLMLSDFKPTRECRIPNVCVAVARKVVHYMYTGKIKITNDDVEDILGLADYFCIDRLRDYCAEFLASHITDDNCLFVKMMADKYSLAELARETTHFISPRFAELLNCEESLELPLDFITQLLKNNKFNYICELQLFHYFERWIEHDRGDREQYFKHLFQSIETSYLPISFVKAALQTDHSLLRLANEDELKLIRERVTSSEKTSSEEIIVCRSRSVNVGDEVELLCYRPQEDCWDTLRPPAPRVLDGLESLLHHVDSLYLLVSQVEDLYGYMHHTEDKKKFFRCNLRTAAWETLSPPKLVHTGCRLVSHDSAIYAIDRAGMIEEYNVASDEWKPAYSGSLFVGTGSTWYILPMPVDRHIYILRAFASGYAYAHAQLSFRLFKYDTVSRDCTSVSEMDASDVDLEDHERLHGYQARPGKLTLKNELGESRLRFHYSNNAWTSRKPRIRVPRFVSEVWGSIEMAGRVYFVGKTKHDTPAFMFYDTSRGRFKATSAPPSFISGLLCNVVVPKQTLRSLRVRQPPAAPSISEAEMNPKEDQCANLNDDE